MDRDKDRNKDWDWNWDWDWDWGRSTVCFSLVVLFLEMGKMVMGKWGNKSNTFNSDNSSKAVRNWEGNFVREKGILN